LACLMLWVSIVAADTLITTDGTTYEGRLVKRTDEKVIFEVVKYGVTMQKEFAAKDVQTVRTSKSSPTAASKPANTPASQPASAPAAASAMVEIPLPPPPPIVKYDGPTYCVIPLKGEIGKEVVASVLDDAFKDILKRKPTVIVIEMESPGGQIHEVPDLVNTIQKYRDFRLVVLVKEAISAAAITTLSVKEIYTTPGSVIGAATAYKLGRDGMPQDIEEKFRSIWRAQARTCAELGGHSPLLGEAMIEAKYNLEWVEEKGKKTIRQGRGENGFLEEGKLLCLTASEAVEFGLAQGMVEDYKALGKAMGLPKWQECKCYAPILMDTWGKNIVQAKKEYDRLDQECRQCIRQSEATDPSQFTYMVYPNGSFTGDSQSKWRSRSAACLRFMGRASEDLDKMAALADKYSQILITPESIRDERDKIDAMKTRVQKRIFKQGRGD
jgi:ATP-dependent protease ClpP protease subunit